MHDPQLDRQLARYAKGAAIAGGILIILRLLWGAFRVIFRLLVGVKI